MKCLKHDQFVPASGYVPLLFNFSVCFHMTHCLPLCRSAKKKKTKTKTKTGLLNFCFYHNNCISSSKAAIFLYSLSWLIFILHRVKRVVPSLGCILGESEKFVGFWFLGNLGILRNSEKFSVILLSSEWSSGDKVRSGSMTDSSYYLKCFPKIYLKFLSFFPENSRIILAS